MGTVFAVLQRTSETCNTTQRQTIVSTNERRREVARVAVTNKAIEGGKPQIMH
jgi:glycerol-3-phosphate cytidylyltransferase-like family protein